MKKYFGTLCRKSKFKPDFQSRMKQVYPIMFSLYKQTADTANAFKTAERYTKAMPTDPNAHLLLASAYIWTGNNAKGIELANKSVDESKDSSYYPQTLCAAAGIFEQAGDFVTAEKCYKESAQVLPQQVDANYGMGIMLHNRAVDKIQAINKIVDAGNFSEEDDALISKLTEESNDFFRQAIPYMNAAINYIDGLSEYDQEMNRPKLYNCLRTLNTCYVRLEMYNEAKTIKARLEEIEKKANAGN